MPSDLAQHIAQSPFVSTHEHMKTESEWVDNGPDILQDLFGNYVGADLYVSRGRADSAKRLMDASAPAIVARAAAPHPASRRPASPALPRAESLIDTAILWREFASAAGCRFDVEKKATGAIVFTLAAGGTSLAMPSKLEGTARRSHTLENIRYAQLEHPWQPLTLSLGADNASHPVVYAFWNTRLVGRCRPKHLCLADALAPDFTPRCARHPDHGRQR